VLETFVKQDGKMIFTISDAGRNALLTVVNVPYLHRAPSRQTVWMGKKKEKVNN
jgi:hypothetical protein